MMLRRLVFAAFGLMVSGGAFAIQLQANELHGYMALLHSGDPIQEKLGTRSIAQDHIENPEVTDAIAEKLILGVSRENERAYVDTLAWHARGLGMLRMARYRAILQWAQSHYQNAKILKHIEEALTQLRTAGDAEQYAAGAYDFARLAAELERVSKESKESHPKRSFERISFGTSVREVYGELGVPDAIDDLSVRGGWGPYKGTALMMTFHYFGQGIVEFDYTPGKTPGWEVRHVMSALGELPELKGDASKLLANSIVSMRGQGLWTMLRPHLQSIPEDKALLGVLMHRIRVSAATRDKWEVKALANGCRVLARTGKEEYLPFLQDIVVRAKGGDVGDYAEDAAETLAELMEEKGERT